MWMNGQLYFQTLSRRSRSLFLALNLPPSEIPTIKVMLLRTKICDLNYQSLI